jgi:hypothetical protein
MNVVVAGTRVFSVCLSRKFMCSFLSSNFLREFSQAITSFFVPLLGRLTNGSYFHHAVSNPASLVHKRQPSVPPQQPRPPLEVRYKRRRRGWPTRAEPSSASLPETTVLEATSNLPEILPALYVGPSTFVCKDNVKF